MSFLAQLRCREIARRTAPSLLSLHVLACASRKAVPAIDPAATAPIATSFSPTAADPVHKARLVALAPRLDEYFRERLARAGATGLSVGIVLEGELVYAKGFGVRDEAAKAPVDTDTVFRIASLTKSFTATAVLKLRDEKRILLDESVATYLPELNGLALPTRDSPAITVRMLLTHSSGLPWDDQWGAVSFGFDDAQLKMLVAGGLSFSSAPGMRFEYSNLGYALLGKIVERVSGVSFREYVDVNILRPLGMGATVWDSADVPPSRLAIGYQRDDQKLIPQGRPFDGVFAPAGGLYTSVRDYARWIAFQLAAYPPRDDAEHGPVRRSSVREMHWGQRSAREVGVDDAPVVSVADKAITLSARSYGFGWFNTTTCSDERRIDHSGWEPGYFSGVILLPEQALGIVSLATTAGVGAIEGAVALLREAGALPPAVQPVASADLIRAAAIVGRLFEQWDPALATRAFDAGCANYPWYANLPRDLAALARDQGRCQSTGALRSHGRLHGTFDFACDRGLIEFEVALTPSAPPRIERVAWEVLEAKDVASGAASTLCQKR